MDAQPGRLAADIPGPAPGSRRVAHQRQRRSARSGYVADPSEHRPRSRRAPLAGVELTLRRRRHRRSPVQQLRAYRSDGASQPADGITPQPLPEG